MTTWNEITNLVMRAQGGDRSAYGQLAERFQPVVYAVALSRLRNPSEAQELAQEVFVHGMTKLGQLRDAQCFVGWLRGERALPVDAATATASLRLVEAIRAAAQ